MTAGRNESNEERRGITRRALLQAGGAGAFFVATGALSGATPLSPFGVPAASADPLPMPNFFADRFNRASGAVGNGWTPLVGTWEITSTPPHSGGSAGLMTAGGFLSVDSFDVSQSAGSFSDDFDRADGAVGSAWTTGAGSWSISGNRLVSPGAQSAGLLFPTALSLATTFTITTVLQTTPTSGARWNGVAVNIRPSATTGYDFYLLRFASDGRWQLLDMTNTTTVKGVISQGVVNFVAGQDYELELSAVGVGEFEWTVRDAATSAIVIERATAVPTQSRMSSPSGPGGRLIAQDSFELDDSFAIEASFRATDTTSTRWVGVAMNIQPATTGHDFLAFRFAPDGRWQFVRATASSFTGGVIASGTLDFVANQDYWIQVTTGAAPGEFVLRVLKENWDLVLDSTTVTVPTGLRLSGGAPGFWASAGNIDVGYRATRDEPSFANWRPLEWAAAGGPPYTLSDVPWIVDEVSSPGTCWAGHRVGQDLLTDGDDQFVAYYDGDREMTVAHRDIATTTWTTKGLGSFVGWDSHNYITMALDRDGVLHVAGNMHAVPLDYHRATTARNISTIAKVTTMVDSGREQRVTYPRFITGPSGELLFMYRDGTAIDGIWYINVYDESTSTWGAYLSTALFDGQDIANAYSRGPSAAFAPGKGPDGRYHLAYMWRMAPGGLQNNSLLSYVRSDDLVSWEKSDGTPVTLPVLRGQGDIVDPADVGEGLHNGRFGLGFDGSGNPVVSYLRYDPSGASAVFVAKKIAGVWTSNQVTAWIGRDFLRGGGSIQTDVTVGSVSPLPGGLLRLDLSCLGERTTAIIDSATLALVTEVETPEVMPSALTTVESTFPGMSVATGGGRWEGAPTGKRYMLKWETLLGNQDRPVPEPWPDPVELKVYLLDTDGV
jgi:hypothetical protein